MDSSVSMGGGAIETDVNSECDGSPGRILRLAVEAHLPSRMSELERERAEGSAQLTLFAF